MVAEGCLDKAGGGRAYVTEFDHEIAEAFESQAVDGVVLAQGRQ